MRTGCRLKSHSEQEAQLHACLPISRQQLALSLQLAVPARLAGALRPNPSGLTRPPPAYYTHMQQGSSESSGVCSTKQWLTTLGGAEHQ